ncbi:unnamed protein product [Acanthoscelides obtectus]|uniref:Uncharacterized protein n=1 Tax=Acanthoscelides obtectus TaxID=200917 RepID=A0A9P0L620_ACAOB|nr:unnamed protein product [Acanthoscelides obtectus]CAK1649102.1 hypothetical protein AOBTE_LOCUS16042 [Acanthoscelides obtectus]
MIHSCSKIARCPGSRFFTLIRIRRFVTTICPN